MPTGSIDSGKWMTLSQAAEQLGVHPTTLRRWADGGEIPVMLTPGGHRRFALEDVARFAEQRRRLRTVSGLEKIWADQALLYTRKEIVARSETSWLAVFSPEDREHKRMLGRRLMGLMLQFVSLSEGGDDILAEARLIGREHAVNALGLGLPLTDALRAAMFFRDTVVETALQLPDTANVRPEANTKLLRRLNTLLNVVQLAIADEYDQVHNSPANLLFNHDEGRFKLI